MSKVAVVVLAIGVLASNISPCLARAAKDRTISNKQQSHLVNIKARNREIAAVLSSFAAQIGAKLVLDKRITGRLSIEAKDSALGEVMDNLCTAFKCDWQLSQDKALSLVVTSRSSSE